MNIIALTGKAGSGKSTIADILVAQHGFVAVSLADPMKRFLREIFDFSTDQLWGSSELRNAPDARYPAKVEKFMGEEVAHWDRPNHLTPRHALQKLGTEWGRAMFEDVWIDYALRTVHLLVNESQQAPGVTYHYDAQSGLRPSTYFEHVDGTAPARANGVVIPDIRFDNELQKIRETGGRIWYRPDGGLLTDAAAHLSEAGLNDLHFDVQIPWEESVENLPAVVARLMETSK